MLLSMYPADIRGCARLALALAFTGVPATSIADGGAITVVFALDTSGSIGKDEMHRARALCHELLRRLPPGSEAALFTFDDRERLLLPWTTGADDLRRVLEIVAPTGRFTALHDALYEASRTLRDAPGTRKALVLITDGKDEGSTVTLEDGLRVAQDTGFPVWTVGVGKVQEKVLRRIAKLTDGAYLPLAATSGDALAATLLGALPAATESTDGASAESSKTASDASGAPPPAPGERRSTRRAMWVAVGAGLALTAGFGVVVLRRRSHHRCARCGDDLTGPHSTCTFCAVAASRSGAPASIAPTMAMREAPSGVAAPLSASALARLNATEEYLEKTVTLRERPVLVITDGPGSGRVFSLSQESTTCLGRAKLNDICLEDISVSSEHCRIRPEDGGFIVHDLKSTNGTYVNEKKVSHHALCAGDTLKVGETSLQYRLDHQRAN
jgi:hypothetical protein